MEIAGKLMEKGINFSKIIDDSFYRKTYIQNQILGRALLESITFHDSQCIFSVINKKDMEFYGVSGSDMDGIIDQLRITEGVECAIFMYETGCREYKVSLRSTADLDVSKIAVYFGGGGHKKAAGCTMAGSVHDVINNLSDQIVKQLN
jgi:phosphoesterase RecJ-like protein